MEENKELILFICGIQLSNSLIKMNFLKNDNLFKFLENLSSKVLCVYDYIKDENIFINCLQKDIVLETSKNIISLTENNDLNCVLIKNLKEEVKKQKESFFMNKYDNALSHHLFFFNKIFNENFYYNLNIEEDDLKKIWNPKCENIMPSKDIHYKIKFFFVLTFL